MNNQYKEVVNQAFCIQGYFHVRNISGVSLYDIYGNTLCLIFIDHKNCLIEYNSAYSNRWLNWFNNEESN